jgi:hypothetical protein
MSIPMPVRNAIRTSLLLQRAAMLAALAAFASPSTAACMHACLVRPQALLQACMPVVLAAPRSQGPSRRRMHALVHAACAPTACAMALRAAVKGASLWTVSLLGCKLRAASCALLTAYGYAFCAAYGCLWPRRRGTKPLARRGYNGGAHAGVALGQLPEPACMEAVAGAARGSMHASSCQRQQHRAQLLCWAGLWFIGAAAQHACLPV